MKTQRNICLVYCFVMLICAGKCIAGSVQNEPLRFTCISTADGLSSNTVSAILKDRSGRLWVATDDGLNRYDGSDFKVYRNDIADPKSLKSNDVACLFEDKAGQIWVGTITGALHLYDPRTDSFYRIETRHSIYSINQHASGLLWVGTTEGLNLVNPKTRTVDLNPASGVTMKDQVAPVQLRRIFKDRRNRMWVGTIKGLFKSSPGKPGLEPVNFNRSEPHEAATDFVTAIQEDRLGRIWVGTQGGVYILSPEAKLIKKLTFDPFNPHSISNNHIFDIVPDGQGKIWVGTDGGLNIIDPITLSVSRHGPDPRTPFSLTSKSVRTILVDSTGIYWLGTYKGGISKYDQNLNIFGLKRYDPYDQLGLSAPFVTSFAEKSDGDIFVGTDRGGLNIYHRHSNLVSRHVLRAKTASPFAELTILSLALSKQGLWAGTYKNGLFFLNTATGEQRQFRKGTDSSSLNSDDIFCLRQDRKGKLWIGTNGGGVNVFDPAKGSFKAYFQPNTVRSKRVIPLNAYIRDIIEDRAGNIWIASHGTGIAVFDPKTQKSVLLDKQTSNLPSDVVLALLEDDQGNVWAGTAGNGLALFDKKSGKFKLFGKQNGLNSGMVHKILQDAQGRIWVSTNDGLSCMSLQTKRFINYTSLNGLQNSAFLQGAGLRTKDNALFFGGISGFNFINTSTIKRINRPVPTALKDLKVGNRPITYRDSTVIDADISIAKSVKLAYGQSIWIAYTALNYTNPKQTQFRYRLLGLDSEWHQVGSANSATYASLSPGKYTFEVQANTGTGSEWGAPTSIAITVKPPLYMTIYAYILYAITPVVILLLLRRRSIRRLHRQFLERQQQSEIEQAQELDKLKIKFLTNLSHEFRTPIALILAPIENLSSHPLLEQVQPQILSIKRNARRLLHLVDQLLDLKTLQEHEHKLVLQRGDIVAFAREACFSFQEFSQGKKIKLGFETKLDRLFMDFDPDKIERILFNLLSNAFKFTPPGGSVRMQLDNHLDRERQKWLSIRVSDTGIGIAAQNHEKIFNRFFQSEAPASVLNQGSGIGLSIVREFVSMHQGVMTLDSSPGKGSTFTVSFKYETDIPDTAEFDYSAFEPERTLQSAPLTSDADETTAAIEHDDQHKARILVVEDNDEFRSYLKTNLESSFKVIEAGDGNKGWQKALSCHPEIIISDVAMPELDGIGLSQKLKADKRTSHIPIILLTASPGEQQQLAGLTSGANDYLTKPFSFEILNAKINNLLLLNRLLRQTYSKQIQFSSSQIEIEPADVKLLKDILAYIEENMSSAKLSVEKLAKHVGMSRGTLYTRILEMSGQTPIEFIRSIKLEKASMLLEKSDMNISQVSFTVGFPTPNYFAKSFKARFGMLPSEYRHLKSKLPADQKLEQ